MAIPEAYRKDYQRYMKKLERADKARNEAEKRWTEGDSETRGEMINASQPYWEDDRDFTTNVIRGFAQALQEGYHPGWCRCKQCDPRPVR